MTPAVVRPLVFTDRLDELRSGLEARGLRPRQEAEAGGWLDLAGEGGLVALHTVSGADEPVAEGEAWLSFEVADADATADALRAAGPAPVVTDEAYGREVRVATPDGATLRIGEEKHDDYGFRSAGRAVGDRGAPATGVVVAEVTTSAPDAWAGLLTALGLAPSGDGLSYGDRRTGLVRLVSADASGGVSGRAPVGMSVGVSVGVSDDRVRAQVRVLP